MKMYIPSIGDQIQLTQDWNFSLQNESRNSTLWEIATGEEMKDEWHWVDINDSSKGRVGKIVIPVIIPVGEILKIDRIYIRKGMDDFDSITFFWKGKATTSRTKEKVAQALEISRTTPNNIFSVPALDVRVIREHRYEVKIPSRSVRFWAKLEDVNRIEFDPA
jgi:hypothetical protein